jgi:hypothetical protein
MVVDGIQQLIYSSGTANSLLDKPFRVENLPEQT